MTKTTKRDIDILVLSDVHLGTYGCHAEELLRYLRTVRVKTLILNGDIIDMWQFSKRYWPQSHMEVVRYITTRLSKGKEVVYLTGNHDEMLRKFAGFSLGRFSIGNKKILDLNGKKAWVFHGDVFDVTMQHSKWLAKLGAVGYDLLILINTLVNAILAFFGKGRISLSKKIKDSVKKAVNFIHDFEKTAADIAIANKYDYVICGHIHKPEMRTIQTPQGSVMYLNSGDWVENLTALEYVQGEWKLYRYQDDPVAKTVELPRRFGNQENDQIFRDLVHEMTGKSAK